jgi:hypothetical protein
MGETWQHIESIFSVHPEYKRDINDKFTFFSEKTNDKFTFAETVFSFNICNFLPNIWL